MAIYDIYSKRQKRLSSSAPDVYRYNNVPEGLRVQIVHIVNDIMGSDYSNYDESLQAAYKIISDVLCREYKFLELPNSYNSSYKKAVQQFFLDVEECDRALDVVEITFNLASDLRENNSSWLRRSFPMGIEEGKDELNQRFREHGIGYQLEAGEIIRIDSQVIHNEVMKPALLMLSAPMYVGANDEFLKAHEHYRHKNYKECLNECLKAFESTMKAICDKRGWAYDKSKATASGLIAVCFSNELVPPFLETQFSTFRQTLGSGVPTVRNKRGGHGQGSQIVNVPEYLAGYALHLTATTILFLSKAEEELT